jgi:hypothetical protein
MTAPSPTSGTNQPNKGGVGPRIAAAAIVGMLLFALLWYTVFSAVTSALMAAGGMGVLVVGSSASDTLETLFEMLANVVLGILAAIGAFFAAIFSIVN